MNDKAKAEEEFLKKQQQEQKEKAEKLYKELTQDAEHQNVEDQININMDKKYNLFKFLKVHCFLNRLILSLRKTWCL